MVQEWMRKPATDWGTPPQLRRTSVLRVLLRFPIPDSRFAIPGFRFLVPDSPLQRFPPGPHTARPRSSPAASAPALSPRVRPRWQTLRLFAPAVWSPPQRRGHPSAARDAMAVPDRHSARAPAHHARAPGQAGALRDMAVTGDLARGTRESRQECARRETGRPLRIRIAATRYKEATAMQNFEQIRSHLAASDFRVTMQEPYGSASNCRSTMAAATRRSSVRIAGRRRPQLCARQHRGRSDHRHRLQAGAGLHWRVGSVISRSATGWCAIPAVLRKPAVRRTDAVGTRPSGPGNRRQGDQLERALSAGGDLL